MTLNLFEPGKRAVGGKTVPVIVIALIAIVLISGSIFVVSPSEMAGERWMGGTVVTATPLGTGVHFKIPLLETVDRLQTSRSVYTLGALDVYTNDNQKVSIDISVIYQIPSRSVLGLLYKVGRAGNVDIDSTLLPVVRDRALEAFAKYNTLTISDQRGQITAQMKKSISEGLETLFGVDVIDVQLTGIHYSPGFEHSIEEAVKAKADAVQAQNAVAQKRFEGEQKTVTAAAEAQAAVEAAKGRADSLLLEADAQAKAALIVGNAIKEHPEYVRYYGLQRWNGTLPQVTGGSVPMVDLRMTGDSK
ncbi:SPFH domain-containing protein [Dyella silvatica]|uniref:SPFH domain-containing protein n=1 Tax=Dyella silvatica TaxID=2992128 RepID=UPI00224FB268|nr:SPFH domain-containing protein [Dyella silvatica]